MVEGRKSSGLSVRAWCSQNDVRESAFYWWRRELSRRDVGRVAIGRKNWIFVGSDNGGAIAAILFTLVATCQRHKLDPFAFLHDVLTRFAATPIQEIDQFLPDRWALTFTVTNSSN